ncbi:MAG TPA: hypothetical protein VFG61_01065 [Gaiellaceae bacterium]|jgi:hypothetical protein|nr:hypothetical protein [Gaiellaceae bacterium]
MTTTLTLAIAERGTIDAPLPDESDPSTLVWVDYAGIPSAYFYRAGNEYWAYLPVVGAFRSGTDGEILAVPNEGASDDLVIDTYRRTIAPMTLQLLGRQVLHASAIESPGGVIGFCADSQTGKSTIAFGLAGRGYRVCADDALAFETSSSGIRVHELPFSVRLRPASAAYFDVPVPPAPVLDEDGRITVGGKGMPLAALCILSRQEEGRGVELRRLAADDVIRMLLPHAYCFTLLEDELRRSTVAAYLELAGRVPVYEVRFTATLEELPRLLGEIERVLIPEAA